MIDNDHLPDRPNMVGAICVAAIAILGIAFITVLTEAPESDSVLQSDAAPRLMDMAPSELLISSYGN